MIELNGKKLKSPANLSKKAKAVLSMIEGGKDWLLWAIGNDEMPLLTAADESSLLNMIQQGLNGDPYIRFNSFRAAVDMIILMDYSDLEKIISLRKTNKDTDQFIAPVVEKYNVLTYAELTALLNPKMTGFTGSRGDIFNQLSFEEALALGLFLKDQVMVPDMVKNKAYSFGYTHAATVTEFIDLVLFFQHASTMYIKPGGPVLNDKQIDNLFNMILPVTPDLLFTPEVDTPVIGIGEEGYVQQAIADALSLGYATVSGALLDILRNVSFTGDADPLLKSKINEYLRTVKQEISTAAGFKTEAGQQGAVTMQFQGSKLEVTIGFGRSNCLYILPKTQMITAKK